MSSHDLPELMLALGRLEGKLDAILQMQRVQEEQIKSIDERLRVLEHARSFSLGAAAVVGAATSALISYLK